MKRFLLSVALLLACSGVAFAQESEFSGGGGGITTAGGSGTAGRVPQFVSATSLEDSKMTTSGTNSGTWTLYDDTAVTGVSSLVIRAGVNGNAWPTKLVDIRDSSNVSMGGFVANSGTLSVWADDYRSLGDYFQLNGSAYGGLYLNSTFTVKWSSAGASTAGDIGLARSAAGILAVTDGSTGQGGIGLSDAATNTVSDALILRHATSETAAASFGTGLVWEGENAGGVMHPMASIDAVWNTATDTSEHSSLVFKNYHLGSEATILTMMSQFNETYLTAPGSVRLHGTDVGLNSTGGTIMYFLLASDAKWALATPGNWVPITTNTYDIGTSSAFVRNNYVSTSIQGTRTQAITDNAAAATFVTIAVPTSNTTVGGRIFYTITAIDAGTAIQTKTGTYSFGLNNIGGTVTGAGTDVLEHSQLSTGTLAPTFSVNISGTNAQFQLVLDTSLDAGAEILKIEYRVQIDSGTATVTPAT